MPPLVDAIKCCLFISTHKCPSRPIQHGPFSAHKAQIAGRTIGRAPVCKHSYYWTSSVLSSDTLSGLSASRFINKYYRRSSKRCGGPGYRLQYMSAIKERRLSPDRLRCLYLVAAEHGGTWVSPILWNSDPTDAKSVGI